MLVVATLSTCLYLRAPQYRVSVCMAVLLLHLLQLLSHTVLPVCDLPVCTKLVFLAQLSSASAPPGRRK